MVTFRPKPGSQMWLMRTHQMVRAGTFLVLRGSSLKEPRCSGWLSKAHPRASLEHSLFQKLPTPWTAALSDVCFRPWESCGAFTPRVTSCQKPAIISLTRLKGLLKGCPFEYKHFHQKASLIAFLGEGGLSFNLLEVSHCTLHESPSWKPAI